MIFAYGQGGKVQKERIETKKITRLVALPSPKNANCWLFSSTGESENQPENPYKGCGSILNEYRNKQGKVNFEKSKDD